MPPGRRGKRAKKASRESGASSIESLPDGVLQHILGFLPARDAVRSCVLARRWRDLWMSATGLRIIDSDEDGMEKLREFVDHLLLLRGTTPLETCELRFTDVVHKLSAGDTLRVNLWFRYAVRYQVRALRLVVLFDNGFALNNMHLVSRHLMQLELSGVAVEKNFLNLSDCPALEQLEIENCDLSLVNKISSESLKRLSVTNCAVSRKLRARIHVPSLVSLLLVLDDNRFNTPALESLPSLVDASIRIVQKNVDSCDCCYSGECYGCNGVMHSNNCYYWCVALDLEAITCILKNSPRLEKLTLEHFLQGCEHKMEMKGSYIPIQKTDAISEHLKIVKVKCNVVDERVYRVLKLLSTFNICFSFN